MSLNPNEKIHRFTILKLHHIDSKYRKFYQVLCECGTEKIINGALIKSRNIKGCGCLLKELGQLEN